MSVVLLNNKVVHYEVIGRGRPVFFLHSWVGSWRYWVPTMQAASTSYRAYVLDFWGFGETARDPENYSLEQQAELINQFIDQMGIGRIVLIGHGFGSIVSWVFAQRFPEVVDRLMLIGFPLGKSAVSPGLSGGSVSDMVEWMVPRDPAAESVRRDANKNDPAAIQTSIASLDELNLWPSLQQSATPCLLLHGQNDPAIQPPTTDQLNALSEKTHAVLFEDSGHYPMLSDPNKFNRLMIDFLALKSGESVRQLTLKEEWKRRVR